MDGCAFWHPRLSTVAPATPAAYAGFQKGDMILRIDNQPVRSQKEFDRLIDNSGGAVTLLVQRLGQWPALLELELMNNQLCAWCEKSTEGMRITAVVAGGPADNAAMAATIVDKVRPGMAIYDQETFGPITTVVRVCGVEEAVRVANDTEYGLAAAVFGADSTRALQVAMRIQAGHVHVNGATVQNEAQAPYGGMKASGYGRFDGRAVINEFTELKWITIEPSDQPYPF